MVYFKKFLTFFVIFCVLLSFYFSCFAVDTHIPDGYYQIQPSLYLKNALINNNKVNSVQFANVYRYKMVTGGNYIMISSPYSFQYCLSSSDLQVGDDVSEMSFATPGSLVYIYNSGEFKYLYISYYVDNKVSLYSNANGMNMALSNLIDNLSIDSLWGVFQLAIPYVLVVVLVALGIYFIVKFLVIRK